MAQFLTPSKKLGRYTYGTDNDAIDPVVWMCQELGLEMPNSTHDAPIAELCAALGCEWCDVMDLLFEDYFIVSDAGRVAHWQRWLEKIKSERSQKLESRSQKLDSKEIDPVVASLSIKPIEGMTAAFQEKLMESGFGSAYMDSTGIHDLGRIPVPDMFVGVLEKEFEEIWKSVEKMWMDLHPAYDFPSREKVKEFVDNLYERLRKIRSS